MRREDERAGWLTKMSLVAPFQLLEYKMGYPLPLPGAHVALSLADKLWFKQKRYGKDEDERLCWLTCRLTQMFLVALLPSQVNPLSTSLLALPTPGVSASA